MNCGDGWRKLVPAQTPVSDVTCRGANATSVNGAWAPQPSLGLQCEACGRPAVAIVTGRRDEGGYLPEIFVCEEHEDFYGTD